MFPKLLVLFLVISTCHETKCALLAVTEVVADLRDYFHSSCVFFCRSENESMLSLSTGIILAETFRRLWKYNIVVGMLDLKSYNSRNNCHNNRPMYILPSTASDIKSFLDKLSRMSRYGLPVWLVWETGGSARDLLAQVNIPFDCILVLAQHNGGHVTLTEVYQVAEGMPQEYYQLGEWTPQGGLSAPHEPLYQRRSDLQGLVITAGNQHNPPFTVVKSKNPPVVTGFFGKVWNLLEQSLNYTTVHHFLPEGNWGVKLKNGSWTGIVGLVARREVHMSATSIAMTASRQKAVDFVMPLFLSLDCIFIKTDIENAVVWTRFVDAFSFTSWLVIIATALVFAAVMTSLQYWKEKTRFSLVGMVLISSGAILCGGQPTAQVPSSAPSRIAFFTMFMFGTLVLSIYSGCLTSILSVRKFSLPFTTIRGFLNHGSYRLGVPRGSSMYNMFPMATKGLLRELYVRVMDPDPEDHPVDNMDGMFRVCHWDRYGFIGDFDEIMEMESAFDCTVTALPEVFSQSSLSFAIVTDSPYRRLFNYHLQKIRSLGVLHHLKSITIRSRKKPPPPPLDGMNLEAAIPVISLLMVGLMTAVLLLGGEWLVYALLQRKSRKKRRKQSAKVMQEFLKKYPLLQLQRDRAWL